MGQLNVYLTDEERFTRNSVMSGECRLWTGATDKDGYGLYTPYRSRLRRLTRYVWEQAYGPIPDGFMVCHTCDNPGCFLLAHMFLGTNDANMADMVAKRRAVHGTGHPKATLTEEQVRSIRTSEESTQELRRRYGVCIATISNIKARRTWIHLT